MKKKIVVLSAPSGGGKSVAANYILENFPQIRFSISATTRQKRNGEIEGQHYFFLKKQEFEEKIKSNEFVEFEEIFGNYYGTLKSEVDFNLKNNNLLLFDIDVKGAYSIKKHYANESLLIFLKPPSLEVLETRLRNRKTETDEQINDRIARAKMEISNCDNFDFVIVNDVLEETLKQIDEILKENLFVNF